MTRDEAITKLTNILNDDHYVWHPAHAEALRMAVEALKVADGDYISRQFMYSLGATCLAKRNDDGELVAITGIRYLPSVQPVITCDGCRFVGTYDTDFPCCGCVRREKDYYEPER